MSGNPFLFQMSLKQRLLSNISSHYYLTTTIAIVGWYNFSHISLKTLEHLWPQQYFPVKLLNHEKSILSSRSTFKEIFIRFSTNMRFPEDWLIKTNFCCHLCYTHASALWFLIGKFIGEHSTAWHYSKR